MLISRHFTPTGKTQEVPASRLRTSSRTQQVLHSEALVEESAGSLELSLPALSSYQFVHGSFNDRHWRCPDEGSGAAQEAPSLRSRKRKGGQKLEVSVSTPEPQSLHHEGVFQERSTF